MLLCPVRGCHMSLVHNERRLLCPRGHSFDVARSGYTAIYSLFYTIMLRQLPVEHPEQLVELVRNSPTELHWPGYWAWEQYEYLRDHNHVFSGITGMGFDNLAALRIPGSDPEALVAESVPGNHFQVLG
jgi:putative ABC transport system permease protein